MTYIPKVYKEPGGDTMVVASGGEVKVESGGDLTIESGGGIVVEPGATLSLSGDGSIINDTVVRSIRSRVTTAQVNAGATLLAAIAGYKYRMIDCAIVVIGGAAAAVTTVDILGTQTTAAKLVAFAQAQLTENAYLKPGITGAAILAAGASFVANDAAATITIGKTGSDITTATHFDVILTYVIEAA